MCLLEMYLLVYFTVQFCFGLNRNNLFGTVTRLRTRRGKSRGSIPNRSENNKESRKFLRSSQPASEKISGAVSSGVRRPGRELDR